MITNTFSIFDPTTPIFSSSNWFSIIIWILFLPTSAWIINSRIQKTFESITTVIFKEFKPIIKKHIYLLIAPARLFICILRNNLPGLIPYVFTATRHLTFTLALAITLWLAIILYAIIYNITKLLSHLIPQGTPKILIPFIVIVETIRIIIRPLTLAVRLSANIVAGHLLINLLINVSMKTFTVFNIALTIPQSALLILELAVTFIQAYVFRVLITLYCAESN